MSLQRKIVGMAFATVMTALTQPGLPPAVIHKFTGQPNDGANPYGGVVFGSNGVLFGTTDAGGGPESNGVVYSLTPPSAPGGSWTETILWKPAAAQGINPYSTLAIDQTGALYGTLFGGALSTNGSVFALSPPAAPGGQWTATILYKFHGIPDAGSPTSGLVVGTGGILYGTTSEGGASNAGTVYTIQLPSTPGGAAAETLLYSFTGGADGGNPFGPVAMGSGGVLYGTARFGGASDYGCVFQLTPPAAQGGSWRQRVLYSFSGSPDAYPIGGVAPGANGVLYGATFGIPHSGHDFGNVYQLAPPAQSGGEWVYSSIHAFVDNETGAADPVAVTVGPNGVLYGSAYAGAASVFELTPPVGAGQPWTERLLGQAGNSYAPVTVGPDGALYGTSFGKAGSSEAGSVFRVTLK
jgi:uncharacterized repeat protein (TIGR03803 family)